MNRLRKKLIILIILLLQTSAIAQDYRIFAEALPPFSFEKENSVSGISVDLLKLLFDKTGKPFNDRTIQFYPWARAYRIVLDQPNTVLFSMARTQQRETLFQWVGPIIPLRVGLVALRKSGIRIHRIADAAQYRIGTLRDGAPEQLLLQAGIPMESIDRATSAMQNIEKLHLGRIDLFAFNEVTTVYLLQQAGQTLSDFELVHTLRETQLYYAFHRSSPPEQIKRLNQALKEIKSPPQEGLSPYQAILQRYLGATPKLPRPSKPVLLEAK